MKYDLIIIGGGPSGLALAQCLRNTYKSILIIDKNQDIGGCHRVIRVPYNGEQVFTEHSPRIYSNNYKNFQTILKDMNTDFFKLFTPYNFSITEIGGQTAFSTLSFTEIFKLGLQFLFLLFNDGHGKTITIGEFMTNNNFGSKSIDMIDRICRLTDGASADNFTLNEFLQIFNQQILYSLYQPNKPNDQSLFKIWKEFLSSNNISFMMNTNVDKINIDTETNLVNSIEVIKGKDEKQTVYGDKIILAVPPCAIVSILEKSDKKIQNTFMDYEKLKKYSIDTKYLPYVSLTFHWNTKLNLPKIYGFPKSSWGLIFIVMSDYMKFSENVSKTVISCTISFTDVISPNNGKTANQSTKEEIFSEAFKQLQEAYPDLEKPTLSLLTPEMYYDDINSKWQMTDKSFISSSTQGYMPFSGDIKNLLNCGTHNGKQFYAFSSIETAVTNAIYLSHILDPKLKTKYNIKSFFTVSDLIFNIIFIIVLIMLIIWKIF